MIPGHNPQTFRLVKLKWQMLRDRLMQDVRTKRMKMCAEIEKKKSMETIMLALPKGAHRDCIAFWEEMDLDEDLFGEFWAVVNPDQPFLDDEKVAYKKWRDTAGRRCEGFVTKKSVQSEEPIKHGYVRMFRPEGEIIEATFKNGAFHGLYRRIMPSNEHQIRRVINVVVAIYKNGDDVADFQFDQKF